MAVKGKKGRRTKQRAVESILISGYTESFDSTRIWYKVVGKRGLTLALCNGLGVSTFFWRYMEEHFKPTLTVLTWDYRGHGRSERPETEDFSMQANAKDLKAVFDDLGIDKAIIGGHSMGVQVIFEFYNMFPERVLGLIPMLGPYQSPADTFLDFKGSKYAFEAVYRLAMRRPEFVKAVWDRMMRLSFGLRTAGFLAKLSKKLMFINPDLVKEEDFRPYFEHLRKIDILVFFKMARYMQDHSAAEILPRIKVPTLIIAGEYDIFTPVWLSEKMHEMIQGSELLVVRMGGHGALVEQPELVNLRIEKFIRDYFGESLS